MVVAPAFSFWMWLTGDAIHGPWEFLSQAEQSRPVSL
jgi:hypothetical protein